MHCESFLPAGFGADVDSFVVHTNYDEYAMMLLQGTEKPSGIKTITVKLYSEFAVFLHCFLIFFHTINGSVCLPVTLSSSGRTMNVTAAVLDDYKILVREHGMTGNAIIMNQNKGTNSYIQDEHRYQTVKQLVNLAC